MFKLFSNFLKIFPESIRHSVLRLYFRVPTLSFDARFKIEVAKTQQDVLAALSLVYESYVEVGLINADEARLKCSFFSLLPHTTIVVAKFENKVVGTLSLIQDSILNGLPSDSLFIEENCLLRSTNERLVEVSSFAIASSFRKQKNAVSLLLMKFLMFWSIHKLHATTLVFSVHPRVVDFYMGLMGFKVCSEVKLKNDLNGAPAIHLSSQLSYDRILQLQKGYFSQLVEKNLFAFFLMKDDRFDFSVLNSKMDSLIKIKLQVLKGIITSHGSIISNWPLLDRNKIIKNYSELASIMHNAQNGTVNNCSNAA